MTGALRVRSRFLCRVLALALLGTGAAPAGAATDGDLCTGAGLLICVPVMALSVPAALLKTDTPERRIEKAIWDGRTDAARMLARQGSPALREYALQAAARLHLNPPSQDEAKSAAQFEIARFLVEEEGVSLSGQTGTQVLRMAVDASSLYALPRPQGKARQLAFVRFALGHGARADGVSLAHCTVCNIDADFLSTMLAAGATLDDPARDHPALLNQAIFVQDDAGAERLIGFGADINAAAARSGNLLYGIADTCTLKPAADKAQQDRNQACVDKTLARARFALAHGAEPNGRAPGWDGCATPYEQARRNHNDALADVLLQGGADADFGTRCRAATAAN